MAPPGNGIFVVRGEMTTLMTAMKRGARWNSTSYQEEDQDSLMKEFIDLKSTLIQIEDLRLIEPNIFLGPFLDVIRSEETTGPITSLALSSINKFLSYGLIDPTHPALAATVENIADAVTHARFVGTDQASDGVVLMKIVQVLRTLMLNPEGSALTNESVCEVMLSCFRICFEPRLNELLRRTAEHALKDIVLLLFMRLPQFAEERNGAGIIKNLKMIAGAIDQSSKKRKSKLNKIAAIQAKHKNAAVRKTSVNKIDEADQASPSQTLQTLKPPVLATTPATPGVNIVDMQGKILQSPNPSTNQLQSLDTSPLTSNVDIDGADEPPAELLSNEKEQLLLKQDSIENDADVEDDLNEDDAKSVESENRNLQQKGEDFVNSMGVRFTPQSENEMVPLIPYGLPCIRELLRFLISLCNPLDKQNTDTMMHMGLNLLTVALEVGADSIGKYDTLLNLVKDDMCKNLFALLNSERLTIFAADLQVCFLLFESLRSNLKFHLEYYLAKLFEIIASENPRTQYEMRELALDNLLQFLRIPGFAAELYINYDCNLYCTNLLEDLIKLLSKNSLSATQTVYSIHQLSLDGLIIIMENIEKNYVASKTGKTLVGRHSRTNSNADKIVVDRADSVSGGEESSLSGVENINNYINILQNANNRNAVPFHVSPDQLLEIKNKKRILTQGTELFNQRPDKGIQFLQENGILNATLDPMEVAQFLRSNSGLDKTMIGDYISKKKNVESRILETFVKSFDFTNIQIDLALRQYLETFRLPGEAPLIFLVMEHFADHWHKLNNEPFANTDSAFRLAYAIIMLNMDQHNHNAKRLNIPMTLEDFQKNLRGLNGNGDFDQEMLKSIFNGIKNEEIIMPAEQTGLVRENYLWKVLLRRGGTKDGFYNHVMCASHDREIFQLIWGPTLAALSFMFDKSVEQSYQKPLMGLQRGAAISSHFNLHENFDALVLTLCKFTTLLNLSEINEIVTSVAFGLNVKAQAAMKAVFGLIHEHGDCVRESWTNILDIIVQLFKLKLLPKTLTEVEDFCEPSGKVMLIFDKPLQKTEAGLFSSLYSYLSSEGQRQPTYDEQEIIKISKRCIRECQIDQIIAESKFLQYESLQDLLKCILTSTKAPNSHKSIGLPFAEDICVFLMELLVKILIQNRDRLLMLWPKCRDQIYLLLIGSSSCGYEYLLNRTTVALLKLAIYLMRNEELCSVVLQSLKMFLMLKPNVILRISKPISIGMYELLKTSAQNIHSEADWDIVFTLFECVGAGAIPPEFDDTPINPLGGTKSDGALSSGGEDDPSTLVADRGCTSDSELQTKSEAPASNNSTPYLSPTGDNWILVNKDSDVTISCPTTPTNSLPYPCKLLNHSSFALVKCWDSLAFIVRNVAHITPYNFESCVKCIRTFVEAVLNGGKYSNLNKSSQQQKQSGRRKNAKKDSTASASANIAVSSDSEDEDLMQRYETIAIQLLDLMHTLHTRTAQIFRWWAEEGGALPQCSALWENGWCPLLQGMARLANDKRRQIRTSAVTCLQRALLVHDLKTLTGPEWASCFKKVLFPLLFDLLAESPSTVESVLLEESRMRTATIMSKVFLHHLTPLITLTAFKELWLEILDYLEKFMKVGSDMLYEAMLESLKNMLLVMHSVRVFHNVDGVTHTALWDITWSRIGEFLPQLKDELFKNEDVHQIHNITQKSIPTIPHPAAQQTVAPAEAVTTTMTQPDPNLLQQQPTQHQSPLHALSATAVVATSIILQPPMINNSNNKITSPIFLSQSVPPPETCPIVLHHNSEPDQPQIYQNNIQQYESSEEVQQTTVNDFRPSVEQDANGQLPNVFEQTPNEYSNYYNNDSDTSQLEIVIDSNPQDNEPKIPISHLIGGNQYPSLTNVPPYIAQSYAPIFVQPQNVHANEDGADIYTDYVKNPYNLTLQQQQQNNVTAAAVNESSPFMQNTQKLGVANVFQSANYFGTDSGQSIPPGSEMLFGGP